MDWCLDLCYWSFGGVDFCFIIFCGVGGWGWLALEFLGYKFDLVFFTFF